MFEKIVRLPREFLIAAGGARALTLPRESGYAVSQRSATRIPFFVEIFGWLLPDAIQHRAWQ
jgi:hypothetical protein